MRFTLNPGESRTYGTQGRFIFIAEATGPVGVEVVTGIDMRDSRVLEKNDQVEFPDRIKSVTVYNRHTVAQTIETSEGEGIFHPNQDGQRVTLTGQDLAIEVTTQPGTPLEMESTDAKPVRVVNKTGDTLDVSGPLTDAELRAVAVPVSGPLTDAELRASPVDVQEAVFPTQTPGAAITGSGTIAANAGRGKVIIKALQANTGIGWLAGAAGSGIALEKGDIVTLETSDAIDITATVGTDQFTFTELEA